MPYMGKIKKFQKSLDIQILNIWNINYSVINGKLSLDKLKKNQRSF